MTPTTKKLLKEALRLDPNERARLAGLLIDSLEEPADVDVEEAWLVEIERRCQEIDAGAVELVPWEEVRGRLLNRDGAAR